MAPWSLRTGRNAHGTGSVASLVVAVSTMLTPGSPTLGSVVFRTAGITAEPTSTAVEVMPAQAVWGQPITFTVHVTDGSRSPILGLVDFSDGHKQLGSCTLSAAICVFTANNLEPGQTMVTAAYRDPQASFAPSHAIAAVKVSKRPTTTTLVASSTSIDFGSTVQLTVQTRPVSSGRVVINDGPITVANLFTDGTATYATHSLDVGVHILTAAFLGDAFDLGSQDAATVSVNRDPSQTELCVASGGECLTSLRVSGPQSFTLLGRVTTATSHYFGTVHFYDRGNPIADGSLLPDGTAQQTVGLGFGDHFLSAGFAGNDATLDSTSGQIPLAVGPSATRMSIVQSSEVADNQSGVSIAVYVSADIGIPYGSVVLQDNGNPMETLGLSGGAASLWTHFGWGRHLITAQYSGNGDYQGSSSSTVHFTSISVYYYHQTRALSCEAASLQIALSASGNNAFSQDTLLGMFGTDSTPPSYDAQGNFHWGDPYAAFVGNVDGYEGDHYRSPFGKAGDPMTGYGVYYPPVASTAQSAGATVLFSGEGISPNTLYDFVNNGHPAVVWVTGGMARAPYNEYIAFDGRRVPYTAPNDHVNVLIGVTDSSVVLADPIGGIRKIVSRGAFEYSFSFLHNMAVVLA